MDKAKILHLLKDVEFYVKDIGDRSPKAKNQINSLGWKLKEIREEVEKPDPTPVQPEVKLETK